MAVKAVATITLVRTNDGETGATGTGVDDLISQYYLSTSDTSPTDGDWVDATYSRQTDMYQWVRQKTTYTDGAITYSTPILDLSWGALSAAELATINAANAQNAANQNGAQLAQTQAALEILSNSVSAMVTDETGASLMTQTVNGWTFDISDIQKALNKAQTDITEVNGDVDSVSALLDSTNSLAEELVAKTAYINVKQDDEGHPRITLGETISDFKVVITNTSIDFMAGTNRVAYISKDALNIESSVINRELKIGTIGGPGFVWQHRDNGNMGLRHVII